MKIQLVLALLIAIPCIIAMVKAADSKARIIPGLAVLAAALAAAAPYLQQQRLVTWDLNQIGWIAAAIMAVVAGVRISHPIYSTLIYTGGALGLLLQLGAITAR